MTRKKREPVTPEEVAHDLHKRTKNHITRGARTEEAPKYSAEAAFRDIKNSSTIAEDLNLGKRSFPEANYTPDHISSLRASLKRYYTNEHNRDITGFFMMYEMPFSTFHFLMERYPDLALEYELALMTLSHNNLIWLDKKGISAGSLTVSLKLHDRFHVPLRHQRNLEKQYESMLRVHAAKEFNEEQKKSALIEKKVIVEADY